MFQIKFVEKIKTNLPCSITFFSGHLVIYEITWKIMVEPGSVIVHCK